MKERKRTTIYVTDEYLDAHTWAEEKARNTNQSVSGVIMDTLKEYVSIQQKKEAYVSLPIKSYENGSPLFRKIEFYGQKIVESDFISVGAKANSIPDYTEKPHASDLIGTCFIVYLMRDGKLLVFTRKQLRRFSSFDPEYGPSDSDEGNVVFETTEYTIYPTLVEVVKNYKGIPQQILDELILELCPGENLDNEGVK